jgi:hypothetical protein
MLQRHIESIHADPCFSSNTDALVHHGRHFGRTVHALCRVHTLLTNGIFHDVEQVQEPLTKEYGFYHPPLSSSFSQPVVRQQREYNIYKLLLRMIPSLEERLLNGSEEGSLHIADLVRFILLRDLRDLTARIYNLHTLRFRGALPMLDPMTQKPSRVQSSTGSRPEVEH